MLAGPRVLMYSNNSIPKKSLTGPPAWCLARARGSSHTRRDGSRGQEKVAPSDWEVAPHEAVLRKLGRAAPTTLAATVGWWTTNYTSTPAAGGTATSPYTQGEETHVPVLWFAGSPAGGRVPGR